MKSGCDSTVEMKQDGKLVNMIKDVPRVLERFSDMGTDLDPDLKRQQI